MRGERHRSDCRARRAEASPPEKLAWSKELSLSTWSAGWGPVEDQWRPEEELQDLPLFQILEGLLVFLGMANFLRVCQGLP